MRRPVLLALALATACAPSFTTELKGESTIPAATDAGEELHALPGIGSFAAISLDEVLAKEDASKDEITSVKAVLASVTIAGPEVQGFDFLDTLELYIRGGDLPEVLLAKAEAIASRGLPAPRPALWLDVRDLQLRPYLLLPSMSIVMRGNGRQPLVDTRLEVKVVLRLELAR